MCKSIFYKLKNIVDKLVKIENNSKTILMICSEYVVTNTA